MMKRFEAVVVGAHEDVVHVEQEAATTTPQYLAEELGFRHRGRGDRPAAR